MFRICFLCVLVFIGSVGVADVTGPMRIIDGDTVEIAGVSVRLHGIDAPEMGQPCNDAQGRSWDCGAWVRDQVVAQFGGAVAHCVEVDVDRYGRSVARCYVADADLGETLVSDGLAWAYRRYSNDYDLDEKSAAIFGRGLWSFTVQNPADYRRELAIVPAPTGACTIKGNISANGHIFHMPGQRAYNRTRISLEKGEQWFCSAREARVAGWRPARN